MDHSQSPLRSYCWPAISSSIFLCRWRTIKLCSTNFARWTSTQLQRSYCASDRPQMLHWWMILQVQWDPLIWVYSSSTPTPCSLLQYTSKPNLPQSVQSWWLKQLLYPWRPKLFGFYILAKSYFSDNEILVKLLQRTMPSSHQDCRLKTLLTLFPDSNINIDHHIFKIPRAQNLTAHSLASQAESCILSLYVLQTDSLLHWAYP
jgi:hypothetical protein